MSDFVELVLTCENQTEAEKIADALLNQHLVACVKFETVHSKYWWQDKLEENDEIRLSMTSREANFEKIEAEVAKLHSYETFVLQAIPVLNVSAAATKWLQAVLVEPAEQ